MKGRLYLAIITFVLIAMLGNNAEAHDTLKCHLLRTGDQSVQGNFLIYRAQHTPDGLFISGCTAKHSAAVYWNCKRVRAVRFPDDNAIVNRDQTFRVMIPYRDDFASKGDKKGILSFEKIDLNSSHEPSGSNVPENLVDKYGKCEAELKNNPNENICGAEIFKGTFCRQVEVAKSLNQISRELDELLSKAKK